LNLKTHFIQTLSQVGVNPSRSELLINKLKKSYLQPQRYYHNLKHIKEMLFGLLENLDLVQDFISTFLAIWFHDVIYETQSHNNEEASADFAAYELQKLKLPESTIKTCCEMILSTKQHVPNPYTIDCQLFLDLDLMILGQNSKRYEDYSNCIRKEYAWVPDENYKKGRSEVLEKFLQRERIYYTDRFYQKYETQAKQNLYRELESIHKSHIL